MNTENRTLAQLQKAKAKAEKQLDSIKNAITLFTDFPYEAGSVFVNKMDDVVYIYKLLDIHDRVVICDIATKHVSHLTDDVSKTTIHFEQNMPVRKDILAHNLLNSQATSTSQSLLQMIITL
jgi:hypothetical protein